MLAAFERDPKAMQAFSAMLAHQVMGLRTRIQQRNIHSARERVKHYLMLNVGTDGRTVELSGTLKDIASTSVTLTRRFTARWLRSTFRRRSSGVQVKSRWRGPNVMIWRSYVAFGRSANKAPGKTQRGSECQNFLENLTLAVSAVLPLPFMPSRRSLSGGPMGMHGQMPQGGMMNQMHSQMMQGQGGMPGTVWAKACTAACMVTCMAEWECTVACTGNSRLRLNVPAMPGQDAFGTIQEVVQILQVGSDDRLVEGQHRRATASISSI